MTNWSGKSSSKVIRPGLVNSLINLTTSTIDSDCLGMLQTTRLRHSSQAGLVQRRSGTGDAHQATITERKTDKTCPVHDWNLKNDNTRTSSIQLSFVYFLGGIPFRNYRHRQHVVPVTWSRRADTCQSGLIRENRVVHSELFCNAGVLHSTFMNLNFSEFYSDLKKQQYTDGALQVDMLTPVIYTGVACVTRTDLLGLT